VTPSNLTPLGFPNCPKCPYRINGPLHVCASCASRTLEPIGADHCKVCSQKLAAEGARCGNAICSWPLPRRGFVKVDALAMFTGAWDRKIRAYKYDGERGWAVLFGRLIVGWLDQHAQDVQDIDLIIGNPTSPDRQPYQHIEAIMAAAEAENHPPRWPIVPPESPVLVKTRLTTPSAAPGTSWDAKQRAALEHGEALQLRADVSGKKILLVDDVFTTGWQMRTVSKLLLGAGVREVRGLVLARYPFGR
jgi:predicted amidophosphoribosyltransferase